MARMTPFCLALLVAIASATCLLAQGQPVTEADVVTSDQVPGSGWFHYLAVDDLAAPTALYAVDTPQHVIRRRQLPSGAWEVLAGLEGKAGFQDGRGTHALFNSPTGLCLSPLGVLVVADADNSCIRQVTTTGESREWGLAGAAGLVSTLAGTCGLSGARDGPADEALFSNSMKSLVCLANCSVLVGDVATGRLRTVLVHHPSCPTAPPPPAPAAGLPTRQLVLAAVGGVVGTLLVAGTAVAGGRAWRDMRAVAADFSQEYRALPAEGAAALGTPHDAHGSHTRTRPRRASLWSQLWDQQQRASSGAFDAPAGEPGLLIDIDSTSSSSIQNSPATREPLARIGGHSSPVPAPVAMDAGGCGAAAGPAPARAPPVEDPFASLSPLGR